MNYVKITPIGLSDSPLDLLYISTVNIESITNIDLNENVGFIDQIVTDEKTLRNVISFVSEYDFNKNSQKEHFFEYGCHNISVHNKNSLVVSYNLNKTDSRKFLNNLISMLVENNLDVKVIKELKENILSPINH